MDKIKIGNQPNDGTGDSIREAFKKVNSNFQELYGLNNLGDGLFFTKLKDTPESLTLSSTSTATLLLVDTFEHKVTQKRLIAGQGIRITNTSSDYITISNPGASLSSDLNPELGGDLNGNFNRAIRFSEPVDDNDLATKHYVDTNGYFSKVNLYVSANGSDTFSSTVPAERQGRSLAYAFKSVNKACQVAESIINASPTELGPYKQSVTLNSGAVTATIYSSFASPEVDGDTRLLINFGGYSGTDQYNTRDIRPGQYIRGVYSGAFAFINDLGQSPGITIPGYNEALCSRDTGLIVDAITQDLLFNTSSQSTFAGLQYWAQGTSNIIGEQTTTTNAIIHLKDLAQKIITGDTTGLRYQSDISQTTSTSTGTFAEAATLGADFDVILNILENGNVTGVTDSIIPNNIVASSTATVLNAYTLLQDNKAYLAAEVNAFVTATNVVGFSYDSDKCARDVGYIVDSVSFDLKYGGNRQAIQAGAYYYGYDGLTSLIPNEAVQTTAAYDFMKTLVDNVITGEAIPGGSLQQTVVPQILGSGSTGTNAEVTIVSNLIDSISNIITNGPGVADAPSPIQLTANTTPSVVNAAVLLHDNRSFIQAEVIAWINANYTASVFEFYDVQLRSTNTFATGEPIEYTTSIPKEQVTVIIESGIYEEHLPIRVAANVSLRGDEFRRVIIKPKQGVSASPWAGIYFRRDSYFDGLTKDSNGGSAGLAAPGQEYGYHYLLDPSQPQSSTNLAKDNDAMDVFLLNDTTLLRGVSAQGHGGFMCVLDPEGQILTKSPYIQNCSSFSKSMNTQVFSGGIFADGFSGNLSALPNDTYTYYTGTMTISVTGLPQRQPQAPMSVFVLGNRYEVDYITGWTSTTGAAVLHLNPRNAGGVGYTGGVIPVNSGTGYSYAPTVVFSQPTTPGSFAAKGTATIVAGVLTQINVTNPGSGYVTAPTVQFIGGNPLTPAGQISLPLDSIKIGFIGTFPVTLDLGTAGNKSILAADFTQINDLGYGVVLTNNAFGENVSVFTYYNHVGYYANNGAQFRSLNGANGYGNYALKAEGADPNEVPIPVLLSNDMVQTATVVAGLIGNINAANTTSGASLYIRGYSFTPYNQSEIEIDHGYATDSNGNVLGIQTYPIVSVSTVTSIIGELAQLNLSNASSLFGGGGGLKTSVSSGTSITIRGSNVFKVTGINAATLVRPSTALQFSESTGTTYRVLSYDSSGIAIGDSKISLRDAFQYVDIATYPGQWPAYTTGTSTVRVSGLSTVDESRIAASTSTTSTQLTFGWKGLIHRVTGYRSPAETGQLYGEVTINPPLDSTLVNVANTSSVTVRAGLRTYSGAEITTRISTLRVSGHDLYNIGAGSAEQSNVPNDIYGPATGAISSSKERVEVGKGRVFAVTTDQDGNFKVGDLFKVDQGSGNLTISGSLTLNQVDGLGFKRGVSIREFNDADDAMYRIAPDVVPTEHAVVSYVNRRLGLTQYGAVPLSGKVGSGYLDLAGVQSMLGVLKMNTNNIDMAAAMIVNLSTSTVGVSNVNAMAIHKGYADTKISLGGINTLDGITGAASSSSGVMTGGLHLFRDPFATDAGQIAVTKRYVDKFSRQVTNMNDVSFTTWPNLPADKDFMMFNSTRVNISTGTTAAVWTTATQITNVANNTATITNTSSAIGGGSDFTVDRSSNSVTFKLVGGKAANNPITNYHVNDNASISQSKLNMNAASVAGWGGSAPAQANLGLMQADSTYFVSTSGFITLKTPTSFPINAQTATRVGNPLIRGAYITGGNNHYNGTTATTWAINASDLNSGGAIVARDTNGNFSAGTITANLTGISSKLNFAGTGVTATNASIASTIVARDSSGDFSARDVTGRYFRGTATSAQYADLAEMYLADAQYEPGTVLEFGGEQEVTGAEDGTRRIAGVVSTDPAYLMNSELQGEYVVQLALTGRVPCKVRGTIRKGDMLVSGGDGFARPEFNPVLGSVIGKALENFAGGEGVIEVVVGRM